MLTIEDKIKLIAIAGQAVNDYGDNAWKKMYRDMVEELEKGNDMVTDKEVKPPSCHCWGCGCRECA